MAPQESDKILDALMRWERRVLAAFFLAMLILGAAALILLKSAWCARSGKSNSLPPRWLPPRKSILAHAVVAKTPTAARRTGTSRNAQPSGQRVRRQPTRAPGR